MGLNLCDIQCVYQWKLSDIIMLPELAPPFSHTGSDINIMAMAIVFIELQYVLPIDSDQLIDINFAHISKPIRFDNKQDM